MKNISYFVITLILYLGLSGCQKEKNLVTTSVGEAARLDVRAAGANSVRITLKPLSYERDFPYSPGLAKKKYPEPVISLYEINAAVKERVGKLNVEVQPNPLSVIVTNSKGELIQKVVFQSDGNLSFNFDDQPVLGLGGGGPKVEPGKDWRRNEIEFDRRGRRHKMEPRWQRGFYGTRNPVPMLIGTGGWGIFLTTPWAQVDLENKDEGIFRPWNIDTLSTVPQNHGNQHDQNGKGIHPLDSIIPGLYDLFVFDTSDPAEFMKEVSEITGPAVLPPQWALGYMQSHRTLEDERQMIDIVDTFREKQIPVDAVIYLGTGFTPRGWNKEQPSLEYNPEVFKREGEKVISDLHDREVKVVMHVVPEDRNVLPTLHGTVPPKPEEEVNSSHMAVYWQQHVPLMEDGVDGFWPDEGDWFNLLERFKRHQMYYQGPLATKPNIRPWSLHRNGYLGVAKWGGWIWSGDTDASWKSLEAQIAMGINHSLSLTPFWGSDIGGFFPNEEKTGELFARWFQFGTFNSSFRSHARTWYLSLPWGFGLEDMGPIEGDTVLQSEMNNPLIEPIAKKYAELRYQLLPYNYTLAWEARDSGMPMMRALWLHYPNDEKVRDIGSQFLWGRDMLIAPVFEKGVSSREIYLPEGEWYYWWTNDKLAGGQTIDTEVDLGTMPIYIRAGAIIPLDPIRQYTAQEVDEPTTLKVYRGADGKFTLYEDDGISLEYLEGEARLTQLSWNDGAKKLTIEPGALEGFEKQNSDRTFLVELFPEGQIKSVTYEGELVEVQF